MMTSAVVASCLKMAWSSCASGGVSIFSTWAPMSAKNMPGSSAGGTRASSRILIPSRTPMSVSCWFAVGAPPRPTVGEVNPRVDCRIRRRGASAPDGRGSQPPCGLSAIRVRSLDRRVPEYGIMAGKDPALGEPRDGLEPLDGMHRPCRIPDHARRDLLGDGTLPVAGVAGEDHRPTLGELDQERLVPRRMPVAPQHGDAGHQLRITVEESPAIAGEVEVLPVDRKSTRLNS